MAESNGAVPDFMRQVVDEKPASARVVAEQAVLALNSSMMRLYDDSLEKFKQNMRDRVPIILALFSGQGGQMILYRPGHAPEVAPPVPIVYQLAKSVGHSTHGHLSDRRPRTWPIRARTSCGAPRSQMYRTQNQSALDGLAPWTFRRRPGGPAHHPATQPGLHGRVPRQGDVHLRGRRGVHPRHHALFGQDHRHRLGAPRWGTG